MTKKTPDLAKLPTGTVALFMTDIESSTREWIEHPRSMFEAISRHRQIVSRIIAHHGGGFPKDQGEGDSVFAAFARASDSIAAAVAIQLALAAESWPEGTNLQVRLALHSGEVELSSGNYFGEAVSRCARIRSLAHGGQILMSSVNHALVSDYLPPDVALKDLGFHELKDFEQPEHVWQLVHPDLPDDFPPLRSRSARSDNLPLPLTSFVGRAREIEQIKLLLMKERMVTLTGPGGCGKTRLAIEIGREVLHQFKDGVYLVPFGTLTDVSLVIPTLMRSVGLRGIPGEESPARLINFLRDQKMLLILDNFEGVVEASPLLSELLEECPTIKLLATSRASLRLLSEHEYHVPPLDIPEPDNLTIAQLAESEAVSLFVERARAVRDEFDLTASNASSVAEICRRLDGLPLAIELAAVHIRHLSPDVLLDHLRSRLSLLTTGPRDLPPRQQTLRNTLDWDYSLLAPEEQQLFRRLAPCGTAFDLESAQAIATAAGDLGIGVVNGIEALASKNLLRLRHSTETGPSFWMLQTIREYASDALATSGEDEVTRDAHARFYLARAEAHDLEIQGPEQMQWAERLDLDRDNFRGALEWLIRTKDLQAELRLVVSLAQFWLSRGEVSEGQSWVDGALRRSAGMLTRTRARALRAAATLARARGDRASARALLHEGLELTPELDDRHELAAVLRQLGNVDVESAMIDSAREFYKRSIAILEDIDDRVQLAETLNNLGYVAQIAGDHKEAATVLEECLKLMRELNHQEGIARALMNLGVTWRELGDYARAATLAKESLLRWRELENKWDVADCLEELAAVVHLQGNGTAAAVLFGGADTLRQTVASRRMSVEEEAYQSRIEDLRRELGDLAFARAWAKGSAMRLEGVVQFALHSKENV